MYMYLGSSVGCNTCQDHSVSWVQTPLRVTQTFDCSGFMQLPCLISMYTCSEYQWYADSVSLHAIKLCCKPLTRVHYSQATRKYVPLGFNVSNTIPIQIVQYSGKKMFQGLYVLLS